MYNPEKPTFQQPVRKAKEDLSLAFVRDRRLELERAIGDLIVAFNKDTSAVVPEITISQFHPGLGFSSPEDYFFNVEVHIEI
jgi:hypothetical protein